MYHPNYSLGLKGDGYAIAEYGIIKIIDNQVYICDGNLADYAKEFEGRWVEIMIADPQPPDIVPMDAKIEPLVQKVRERGLLTLSSCQGHMEYPYHYPFVSIFKKPDIPLADSWELRQLNTNVWRLKTIEEAKSENQLLFLQESIAEQLAIL